ncbi:unnamed protein product, partial [Effrenium voratum]
ITGKFMDLLEQGGLFTRDDPEQESMLEGVNTAAVQEKLKEVEVLRKIMGAAHSDFRADGGKNMHHEEPPAVGPQ